MGVLPPLLVRLEADVSNFTSGLGKAEKQVQRMSRGNASDFDKLATVGKAAFLGISAAAVGLGAVAVNEALQQEAANARLTTSLKNAGSALTAVSAPFQKAQAAARQLGFSDDDATDSLAKLVNATKSPTESLKDLALAQDVARGRNIDLASATDLVVKVETGHVALLGRLGINVKDNTGKVISQTEALKRLSDLYGGQASAYADTFAGKTAVLKAQTSDLAERIGFALIPKIEALATGGSKALDWADRHATASKVLAGVIAGPLVLAMGAYIVQQGISVYETGLMVASKLPQTFLTIGAAIRGTTAAEVVLNETTAATNATMLLGVGAVGVLAGAYLYLLRSEQQANAEAAKKAATQVSGAGSLQAQLDAENKAIDAQKQKVRDLTFSWSDTLKGGIGQAKLPQARTDLKGMEENASLLKDQITALGGATSTTAGDLGGLSDATDTASTSMTDLWSATTAYMSAQDKLVSDTAAVTTAQEGIAQKSADQAAATRDAAKANDDLRTAQDALSKAQQEAPRNLERATLDNADAIESVTAAEKTLADNRLRYGSLNQKTIDSQEALTRSRLDAADAADSLSTLQKAGDRPESVVSAEQGVADAKQRQADAAAAKTKADQEDPVAAIAKATSAIKDDQVNILASRVKELGALKTFNTEYGTTLTLADAFTGKIADQVTKQEQLLADQATFTAGLAAAAGAPQSAFVSDGPTASGGAASRASAPNGLTPSPTALGDPSNPFVQKYGPHQTTIVTHNQTNTVNATTNANPQQIGESLQLLGRVS